jgi:hypothetical protein
VLKPNTVEVGKPHFFFLLHYMGGSFMFLLSSPSFATLQLERPALILVALGVQFFSTAERAISHSLNLLRQYFQEHVLLKKLHHSHQLEEMWEEIWLKQ